MANLKPINPERFFSTAAKRWYSDPLKDIGSLWFGNEDRMINMGGGMPTTRAMPFESMHISLKNGSNLCIEGTMMDSMSQYGPQKGCAEPLKVFRDLVLQLHNPPTASIPAEQGGLDVQVSAGNSGSCTKVLEVISDPGNFILIDEPCFSANITKVDNLGLQPLAVQTDINGLIPSSLRHVLSRWSPEDATNPRSDIPKLLFTVPHGSNPTGANTSPERKNEIYQICREYDILIVEDDPYYYLQYDHEPYPSYLSMDEDGRVIRLDSFSKIFAPGFRCGLVSGNAKLLSKMSCHVASTMSHPNNVPQFIYQQLLVDSGMEGFLKTVKRTCALYKEQRDILVQAVNKYLRDLVEFTVPSGGMFLWMKVLGLSDTKDMIKKRAIERGVLVLPGSIFLVDRRDSPYIRVSFANASHEDIYRGIERLASVIREELETVEQPTTNERG